MKRALASMATALALTLPQAQAARFEIGLMGDAPYTDSEVVKLRKVIQAMNAADLAFVVHVGDLHTEVARGTPTPCTEAMLADRKALLQSSRHPLIFTPGDNDWTDCHTGTPSVDPVTRLNAIRRAFYAEGVTLGQKTFPVKRQAKYVENLTWERDGILFVTLHMVGSNNNLGRTPESDAEHAERNAANIAWMKQAFEAAEHGKHKAVVIFTQANPFFEDRWPAGRRAGNRVAEPPSRPSGFRALLVALELEVASFERPVLFVHGDTHYFRVDKPLFDTASGRILENLTRVESFGSPYVHWVRIVVDTEKPGIFEFKPELVAD